MITNFFIPELNNHDVQELWFQQDGATYHTARATIDLLKDTFGNRLISRFGPVNWPPRCCDLRPETNVHMLFQNDIPIDVACHRYTLNMQVSSVTKNNSSPNASHPAPP
ncbi:hypothetical protein TNCV_1145981 [Trichonephila clavipes]|nr:hypothetical protein TNCV_1145981 [Trichonephila clavipes]